MKPDLKSEAATASKEEIEGKTLTNTINHPLLNKWLTAEVINNLPDETAQAVADLIQATVKRRKQSVNAHTYYEYRSKSGGGKPVSLNIARLTEALLREGEGGVNGDKQK